MDSCLVIPEPTKRRNSQTRHAAILYCAGGPETNHRPCRSLKRLSELSGVHRNTLERVMKEDNWDAFVVESVGNYQLNALPLLPSFGDKMERIEKQLEKLIDAWEECETGSDEAARILSQVEKCSKLLGLDKRLATAARLEELQRRKAIDTGPDAEGYGDGQRILDVD